MATERSDTAKLHRLLMLHGQLETSCALFEQIVGELEGNFSHWSYVQSRVTVLSRRLALLVENAQAVALYNDQLRRDIRKEKEAIVA